MTKAFRESGNKCAMLKKVYSVKTKTTVSFSSRMKGWVFWKKYNVSVSKSLPSFLRWPLLKNTADIKKACQGQFVVIVEGFAR